MPAAGHKGWKTKLDKLGAYLSSLDKRDTVDLARDWNQDPELRDRRTRPLTCRRLSHIMGLLP